MSVLRSRSARMFGLLVTVAACLAAKTGDAIPAGQPALKTTATFAGGQTRKIVEVSASAADRELVLARLATGHRHRPRQAGRRARGQRRHRQGRHRWPVPERRRRARRHQQ